MTFEERVRLINRLDSLIRRKYRGNSSDYSAKMNISRSAFFRLLDFVRTEFDSPICYNRVSGYYEYSKKGIIFFGFLPTEFLTENALKKVQGGTTACLENNELKKLFTGVSSGGTDGTYI